MAAVFNQEFDEMITTENRYRFRQFHFAKIKCVKLVIRTVYVLHYSIIVGLFIIICRQNIRLVGYVCFLRFSK
jgi:hypothetical protein